MEFENTTHGDGIKNAIVKMHEQLEPGGPRVDWEKLSLFVDGVLDPLEGKAVVRNVLTWEDWHRDRLEMIACDDIGSESNGTGTSIHKELAIKPQAPPTT